jgi:hypothetical protein
LLNRSQSFPKKKGGVVIKKKILLTVDGSNHSKNAVKYACKISLLVKGLSYTLFNVQPPVSWYVREEASQGARARARAELEKLTGTTPRKPDHFWKSSRP